MSEWQDISTAPKDGARILLWAYSEDDWDDLQDALEYGGHPDAERQALSGYRSSGSWFQAGAFRSLHAPTHWMPLPSSPTTQGDEK